MGALNNMAQRGKTLIIFSNDVIENSNNILGILHSIKEKIPHASYWVFTSHQLQELNVKLNILLGRDKWDIESRIHSIYGMKVKRGDRLQNRKSWSLIKAYCDMDCQIRFTETQFPSKTDIHAQTAKNLGVSRLVAKTVNLGAMYGSSMKEFKNDTM